MQRQRQLKWRNLNINPACVRLWVVPIPRGTAGQICFSMAEQSKNEDLQQRPKPLTDFYGEDRHEFVQKIAYQYWEKRGSPLGSPEIDWFAAEKKARSCLLASGIELGPDGDLYSE
jgi:hypothetical protein